jgi:hypothetical protein
MFCRFLMLFNKLEYFTLSYICDTAPAIPLGIAANDEKTLVPTAMRKTHVRRQPSTALHAIQSGLLFGRGTTSKR